MNRREVIAGLGGAVALSVVARAQQPALPVVALSMAGRLICQCGCSAEVSAKPVTSRAKT
jgi:hypothetical protein